MNSSVLRLDATFMNVAKDHKSSEHGRLVFREPQSKTQCLHASHERRLVTFCTVDPIAEKAEFRRTSGQLHASMHSTFAEPLLRHCMVECHASQPLSD